MSDDALHLTYFCVYPQGDRKRICVIDLDDPLYYEKSDWAVVDPFESLDRDEAIRHARKLAADHDLGYEMFESRYGNPDEYLGEFT